MLAMPTAPSDPTPFSTISHPYGLTMNEGDDFQSNLLINESEIGLPPTPVLTRQRRPVCERCHRPCNVCICSELPSERIRLLSCHCVVLQHPRELERKNRSLPFLQLSLDPNSLTTIVSRRLDVRSCPPHLDYLLKEDESHPEPTQPNGASKAKRIRHCWLIFPSSESISLSQALCDLDSDRERGTDGILEDPAPARSQEEEKKEGYGSQSPASSDVSLTVLFLDGTWQLAGEMYRWQEWDRFRLVQLDQDDFAEILERPCRYPMRTPPSPRHLSTHECISYVLSRVEHHFGTHPHPELYQRLLRPLDLAVQQYQAFLMKNNR